VTISSQVFSQGSLDIWRQTLLHQCEDAAIVASIAFLQVLADPGLDIRNLWEWIFGLLLAGVQLGETNSEANFIHVRIRDDVISGSRNRWIDQKVKKSLGSEAPSFGIAAHESLRVGEGFGVRDYGSLAIDGSRELLCVWEDDGKVYAFEDTATYVS
jgi:hypothetical protein